MARRDGHVVEEAEAHRLVARGMVAGRAHGAEGIATRRRSHRRWPPPPRRPRAARRARCRGRRRCRGPAPWRAAAGAPAPAILQLGHVAGAVGPFDLLERGQRRVHAHQRDVQPGGQQVVVDGIQPLRALGVAVAHVVQTAVGVAVEGGAHRGILARFRAMVRRMDKTNLTRQLPGWWTRLARSSSASEQIEDCMACLLAGGHLLIEDVPGVGKTTLAHALAVSLGLNFSRVQFTADLMPSDLIGVSVFERAKETFVFHPRPGVHAGAAGRRDQPRRPQDAERAAGSDGGAAGQVENETRALPRPSSSSPRRTPATSWAPTRCRRASSTASCCASRWATPTAPAERALLAGEDRRQPGQLQPVMRPAELVAAQQAVLRRACVGRAARLPAGADRRHPRSAAGSSRACRRAPASPCCARPRRAP
jgi:MoxR-like ATPase